MALTDRERDLITDLNSELRRTRREDQMLERYYRLKQTVRQLGMAIPPTMRDFLVVVNWPRVVVDTICRRQRVRSLILPGQETADPVLQAIWDANNLSAHLKMFNRDSLVYGRAFMSVGGNEADPTLPIMRVESPKNMAAKVNIATETMEAACRFSPTRTGPATSGTLFLPNSTVRFALDKNNRWEELERDEHYQGAVPVVMHLNRRMSGQWQGESEMTDIIPLTDSVARSVTNLQFAQEAHGIPRMWMTGVAKGDFVDDEGKPIPQFEAYFDAIHTLTKTDAKIGQLTAADLKNFETAIKIYGTQAATVTGFPARYFGLTTANPAAEGAIRAEESELVTSVEDKNDEVGMTLGWAAALAYEFATGTAVQGNRVRTDWFDPGTPTTAQLTDALVKQRSVGAISREGMWDELGWSEARKAKERRYLEQEKAASASDPDLVLARHLAGANLPNANA